MDEFNQARIARIILFFAHKHLPTELAQVSAPFGALAQTLVEDLANGVLTDANEVYESLRSLLVAKDAAVRAAL